MEKTTHSLKYLQQRRFFMVLPLLVLPFISMLFWALGGGKGSEVMAQSEKPAGLNTELPKASIKDDKFLSKYSFYEKAEKDSAKFREQIKNDPYYKKETLNENETNQFISYDPLPPQSATKRIGNYQDPNEEKVYKKLAQLNEQLEMANKPVSTTQSKAIQIAKEGTTFKSEDIDRLENMMQVMRGGNEGEDPEMQQLNELLEKIMDVQHPERVNERRKKELDFGGGLRTATLTEKNEGKKITDKRKTFVTNINSKAVGFYGTEEEVNDNAERNAISAMVYEDQTLVSGAIVKLRLLQDLNIKEHLIPKGQFVYGVAELDNERLIIGINSIRYGSSIYVVKLKVYDLDGMEGIYVPGAIGRDVAKQSANSAVQSMDFMTMDRSLPAQAAAAGVNAAKSLLTKKVKKVNVTLKGGYQVLLKNIK